MPHYRYQARDKQGNLIEGRLELESEDAVAHHLLGQGVIPVSISVASAALNWKKISNIPLFEAKPSRQELSAFCRQMYTLYKAGVPLAQAMARVSQTTGQRLMARALVSISQDLASGIGLAIAVEKFPRVFPGLMINLLRVGEESGRLEEAFLRLSEYLENEDETVKQLKSVLRYPVIVIVAIVIAFVVITIFVIPAFEQFFNSFNAELPWATVILLKISAFMRASWMWLIVILVLCAGLFRWWVNTPAGQYRWHRWQLRVPILGPLLKKVILARFARSYAMVAKTGISLHRGLGLVANILDNAYFARRLQVMQTDLANGEPLAVAATHAEIFPDLVLQMLTVGEESGSLDELLEQMADFYEREVAYGLKRLKDALEPLLLILIGAMVLVLALGIFLPMWGMSGVIKH